VAENQTQDQTLTAAISRFETFVSRFFNVSMQSLANHEAQ
jgi:hypothetical protein